MKTEPNQCAFPSPDTIHPSDGTRHEALNTGLTKREHFAAMCLQGILAEPESVEVTKKDAADFVGVSQEDYVPSIHYPIYAAKRALHCADALINALNQTKEEEK